MHDERQPETTPEYTWITAAELARRHKVTAKTIRQMARRGRIPCIRYGTTWRFPLELVEHTLLEQATDLTP